LNSSSSTRATRRPGNTQNGGTVLAIANLVADSESGSPDSYSSFLVTMGLSRLVSEIFACGRQTANVDRYYSLPHVVAGQLTTPIRHCQLLYRNTPHLGSRHATVMYLLVLNFYYTARSFAQTDARPPIVRLLSAKLREYSMTPRWNTDRESHRRRHTYR